MKLSNKSKEKVFEKTLALIRDEEKREWVKNEELKLWQQDIFELIKHHMAFWGPESIRKAIEEYTTLELIVYLADYFSSRKELETKVDSFGMDLEYE